MTEKILITGGAGFIGSHLGEVLVEKHKHEVTVLDQVNQISNDKTAKSIGYFHKAVNYIQGSVNDYRIFEDLVKENDVIFHLAAEVGVGQSMYQISDYINTNILGTANLFDILTNSEHNIKKVIIASSNTVYGEGKALC